jgi:hypothetical protein
MDETTIIKEELRLMEKNVYVNGHTMKKIKGIQDVKRK